MYDNLLKALGSGSDKLAKLYMRRFVHYYCCKYLLFHVCCVIKKIIFSF